uniref:Failed axon connections n=1 Tax=Panagrolaimus sp. JU765 TaxID=591449 RepID=A0AC34QSQ1_9BILA
MGFKRTKGLLVRDWKEGVVNLVTYPRAKCCPNVSPWSLKVETFLRLFNIPYQVVNNQFKNASTKGQVPFIELNGRHHADSANIVEFLTKEFNLPIDNFSPKQKADARAYTFLLEDSFIPAIFYFRSLDPKWMFTEDKGLLGNFTGAKKVLFKTMGPRQIKSAIKKRLHVQGMGRNSPDEVEEIMKRDLKALSNLLADKDYFFGSSPGSFDATAFACLAMLLECPQPNDSIVKFVDSNVSNLRAFFNRVKAQAWPDWDHVCQNLELNRKTDAEIAAEVNQQVAAENFEKSELQAS